MKMNKYNSPELEIVELDVLDTMSVSINGDYVDGKNDTAIIDWSW